MTAATTTPTSQAIVQDSYGDDVFRLTQIATPTIADNEVLIRVHAAGMDRGTWHMMAGLPYLLRVVGFGLRRPKARVPGLDVAGTVAAVGSAATRFAIGDEVFGIAKGSFAEYTSALERKLSRKPSNLSFTQAAVVPVSGLTALQALRDAGQVKSGQHVLIIGASGGVGSYAVQLAKAFGAQVTGVCSTSKIDLVRSLGADHVIDYTQQDFSAGATRYDLILDIGGNPALSRLRRALTPTGTAVIIGGEEGGRFTGGFGRPLRATAITRLLKGQRLVMFASKENGDDLRYLTELIEAGTVSPTVDATYPLGKVRQAMRHLEAGSARGKIAIAVITDTD